MKKHVTVREDISCDQIASAWVTDKEISEIKINSAPKTQKICVKNTKGSVIIGVIHHDFVSLR
jgi:ribosomal protein S3